jgi:GGDEF domain-containing protein
MALTGNGLLTANVGLILVVIGALVVDTRWFAIAAGLLVLAWLGVLLTRGPWDQPVDALLLYVLVAGMSAILVHVLRVHGRARLVAALDEARTNAVRHDVTGLWNRRGARIAARPLLGQARRDHDPVWAVVMDVVGITAIEQHLGGPAADQLLAALGRAVARCEDDGYVAASWSASRFVLLGEGPLPEVDDLVTRLAVRARATGGAVDLPWSLDPGVAQVSDPAGEDVVDRLVAAALAERSARRLATDADTGRAA